MPTLNWIGKEAVVNHHHAVPFHLLRDVPELSVGEPGAGNLIVQGDNLVALKALLPYYAGQVKCIYIDPPYNTGNEGWIYSDNVKSPIIEAWLKGSVESRIVTGEKLDRHDRWLCMMYPRLALLRQFLREDGAIFVSIGDDEVGSLLYLLDEIFGDSNRLAIFSWKSRAKPVNVGEAKVKPQQVAEYVCVYARMSNRAKFHQINSGEARAYPFTSSTNRRYRLQTILKSNRGESKRETMQFEIAGYTPPSDQRWQGGKVFIQDLNDSGYIEFKEGTPFRRYFADEEPDENDPLYSFLPPDWTGTAETGKEELNQIVGNRHGFDTVKPTLLMKRLLAAVTKNDDIILDSFGGSGTTGQAVSSLNKRDGGNRRFILVEMESKIARDITAERVKRVALGYTNAKGEPVAGLGGGFRFCELGEPLFDESGKIRESVRFADLARHVYFTETGEPLPELVGDDVRSLTSKSNGKESQRLLTSSPTKKKKSPVLGVHNGRAVCLLYNGILKDKSPDGGNALTQSTLALLRAACDGQRVERLVVYGTSQRLSPARLKREGVTFKQIPYSIRIT